MTGYSKEESLSKNPRLFESGNQPEAYYANLWSTISAGKVWQGEAVNKRKDGTTYTEEMTITPLTRQVEDRRHQGRESLAPGRAQPELKNGAYQRQPGLFGYSRFDSAELSRGGATRDGLIAVATADDPTCLDLAILKRPGRFDRVVQFRNPDGPAPRVRRQRIARHARSESWLYSSGRCVHQLPNLIQSTGGL